MAYETLKLELIEWLAKLEDEETICSLKMLKDSIVTQDNWEDSLTDEEKSAIESGLKDVDDGRVTPHEEVAQKYGLK